MYKGTTSKTLLPFSVYTGIITAVQNIGSIDKSMSPCKLDLYLIDRNES